MQQVLAETVRKIPLPEWMPAAVRRALAGQRVSVDLPRAVRLRLRQPEKMRVSEWAERHRMVSDGAHEGPWRHEYAPHAVKIMDTFGLPWVREVWMCAVEQSAKTAIMQNCMGWAADCDPGNIFYLMPTEDTSKKIVGEKILPMFRKSPRLARYLSRRQDDTTLTKITLQHGMSVLPAWANSPSSMATFAAKHCFGDEVDKYPAMSGREADPITLIKKRNRTYKGRYKRFFGSTPAGLYIHKGTQRCHQVWEYRVRCPHCGELIRMDVEHLVMPEGATPESVEQSGAEYACNSCGSAWDESARLDAIRAGRWFCVKGFEVARPAKVGFHLRAWECLDIALTEIAAAWLKSEAGDKADKIAWANGYEAADYQEEEQAQRQEEGILRLVDAGMPRGIVPRNTSTLIALADTQQVGFMYQLVAFEWGSTLRAHLVDHGFVEHFDDLKALGEQDWADADGTLYRCRAGFIDSGGGTNPYRPKHTRTVEVYDFCRLNRLWRPLKGQRRDNATPWEIKRQDFYPTRDGKKKPIPGGLKRYNVDVTLYKNRLADKLNLEPDSTGSISLHAGLADGGPHSGQKYAAQLCAEYQDDRGYWECLKNRANHFWDCWVYAFAAADILGVARKKKPVPPPPEPDAEENMDIRRRGTPREGGTADRALPSWR